MEWLEKGASGGREISEGRYKAWIKAVIVRIRRIDGFETIAEIPVKNRNCLREKPATGLLVFNLNGSSLVYLRFINLGSWNPIHFRWF